MEKISFDERKFLFEKFSNCDTHKEVLDFLEKELKLRIPVLIEHDILWDFEDPIYHKFALSHIGSLELRKLKYEPKKEINRMLDKAALELSGSLIKEGLTGKRFNYGFALEVKNMCFANFGHRDFCFNIGY